MDSGLAARAAPRNDSGEIQGERKQSITPDSRLMYYVYILASRKHGTLYIGATNDLVRRV
jgi:hypothetical protein